MKKVIVAMLLCILLPILIIVYMFYYAFLYSPSDITKEQKGMFIEIQEACREQMEEAYWLMYSYVPEAFDTTAYGEWQPDKWDSKAYDLMLEADQIARTIENTGTQKEPSFVFFKPTDFPWYLALDINMVTPYQKISLIYCPHEIERLGKWVPLDGQPYWYYYIQDYA